MNRQVGVHPAVAIATVLDPRFKLLNGFNNNEDKVRIWDALLAEMILRRDIRQLSKKRKQMIMIILE